jgi:hypothetical protein
VETWLIILQINVRNFINRRIIIEKTKLKVNGNAKDNKKIFQWKKNLLQPGVEPGSNRWQRSIITARPLKLLYGFMIFFWIIAKNI